MRVEHHNTVCRRPAVAPCVTNEVVAHPVFALSVRVLTTAVEGDVKSARPRAADLGHIDVAHAAQACLAAGIKELSLAEWEQRADFMRVYGRPDPPCRIEVLEQKPRRIVVAVHDEGQLMLRAGDRALSRKRLMLPGVGR